jgi:hypothetical protein
MNVYSPAALEVAFWVWPLAPLVSVTIAPGTTAPLGSFTTPRREVVATWATIVLAQASSKTNEASAKQRLVTFSSKRELHWPVIRLLCFCGIEIRLERDE